MELSYNNYQTMLSNGLLQNPCIFSQNAFINRTKYHKLENIQIQNGNSVDKAFRELRKRIDRENYFRLCPIQSSVLDYSSYSLPGFKFVLPELLVNDWLGIMDWHNFHRDHIIHQPLTAYITQRLLGNGNSANALKVLDQSFLDICVENILNWTDTYYLRDYIETSLSLNDIGHKVWVDKNTNSESLWKALLMETAFIASLFHDLGYPWQYINSLNNKLEVTGVNTKNPSTDATKVLKLFNNRLLIYPLNGYLKLNSLTPSTWEDELINLIDNSIRKTHGFLGALSFLYLNDFIREYPISDSVPMKQFCIDWAAMAIMMHDMEKIYHGKDLSNPENKFLRLNMQKDPLSFVVTLADFLQDFERPCAKFSSFNNHVEIKYEPQSKYIDIEIINTTLLIKYYFEDEADRAKKRLFIDLDFEKYFDHNKGYLDMSSIGITNVDYELNVI